MWLIILVGALSVLVYLYLAKIIKYWENKGVSHLKPWPFSSSFGFFGRRPIGDLINDFYNAYPNKRYMGFYQFLQPTLMIRDPELIKQITVKWFDAFPDHRSITTKDIDPMWAKNIFAMKSADGWHDIRSTLSPFFTSSKLRNMFTLIQNCAEQFADHFQKQENTVTIELKDTFSRFAVDVIGTTAFGVTCNSLEEPKNEFYLMGNDASNFTGLRSLKFLGFNLFPTLMKLLDITVFSKKVATFFRDLVKETLRIREEKHIVRPDMIHLLMEARRGRLDYDNQSNVLDGFAVVEESEIGRTQKKQKVELTDEDITGIAVGFFFAGFETISNALCFLAYELAINPEIQKILYKEIDATLKDNKGKISYETLLKMKYLDMVLSEILRKWPPVFLTDRECVKPFTIEPEEKDENPLHVEKGLPLWIPIYSIHRDPHYYPDPEKFNPERFSDENKHNIKPHTYLPFGGGPRNCIGSRFALLESKLLIVEILRKFEFVPVEKTQIPLQPSKNVFKILPDDGIWLGLKPRTSCM